MKKLLLLFCLFHGTSSFAQTKEETLEWITNNIELLFPLVRCNGINGDETAQMRLEVKRDSLVYTRIWQGQSRWSVALKDILYQDVSSLKPHDQYFNDCPFIGARILQSARDKIVYQATRADGNSRSVESSFALAFDKKEQDNSLRVLKAIMHLAKLSGAKENKQMF